MTEEKSLTALKQAILLEKRGKAFYGRIAEQTDNSAVKEFFELMAAEESHHIEILVNQFKHYRDTHGFIAHTETEDDSIKGVADKVLNPDVKARLASAGFEAAAISAAILMEERAITLYRQRAEESDDTHEKALYQWLSEWEGKHLAFLTDIDRALTEEIWMDNKFWPF